MKRRQQLLSEHEKNNCTRPQQLLNKTIYLQNKLIPSKMLLKNNVVPYA